MHTARAGRLTAALAILASCVAACGSTTATSHFASTSTAAVSPTVSSSAAATPVATATPTPSAATVASCAGGAGPATGSPILAIEPTPDQVALVDLSGAVLNQTGISSPGRWPVGYGPDGVYLYDTVTGDLSLFGATGQPKALGQIAPMGDGDLFSAAESPNGQCWLFSDTTFDTTLNGTTKLYAGIGAAAPVVITTLKRSDGDGGGYSLLAWDASGVILGTAPTGVGGGPSPFVDYSNITVVRLDPVALSTSSPLCGSLSFEGTGPDGSLACVTRLGENAPAQAGIQVVRPGGTSVSVSTGQPMAGHVLLPDASTVAYCTTDDNPAPDGALWTETLWEAQLGATPISPRKLMSGDQGWCETGAAVSNTSIAEILNSNGAQNAGDLAIVDLTTGGYTKIGSAAVILGLL